MDLVLFSVDVLVFCFRCGIPSIASAPGITSNNAFQLMTQGALLESILKVKRFGKMGIIKIRLVVIGMQRIWIQFSAFKSIALGKTIAPESGHDFSILICSHTNYH